MLFKDTFLDLVIGSREYTYSWKAELWIWINWIRIRIRIQHFKWIWIRLRSFDDQKLKRKNIQLKIFFIFFLIKKLQFTYVQASEEAFSPSKENIQHFKNWNLIAFSMFVGHFCPPGSHWIRIHSQGCQVVQGRFPENRPFWKKFGLGKSPALWPALSGWVVVNVSKRCRKKIFPKPIIFTAAKSRYCGRLFNWLDPRF
jgi:hypothetical protein